MTNQRVVNLFVVATIVVMLATLAGATWWGRWHAPSTVDAHVKVSQAEIEKAARELKPAAPIDRKAASTSPEPPIQMAKATPARMPLDEIQSRLAAIAPDNGGRERAELESALGFALLENAQPDLSRAGLAFISALDSTSTPDERVPMARDFGLALLDRDGNVQVIDVTEGGRFIGAKLSPERMQIEAIRGIAFDALGLGMRAQDTFHDAFETMLDTALNDTETGKDVARMLGLRLARKYRDAGDASMAKAVAVRLRAWLGEDDLVMR